MRSRKRPSKIRVLIVPQQGIAGAMVHELAMLFCHAGSHVFFALSEKAQQWITPELTEEITGNQPFCSSHSPGWLKSRRGFDLAVIFSESPDLIDIDAEFISLSGKAQHTDILVNNFPGTARNASGNPRMIQLPKENFAQFYQRLFASQIRLLHGKKYLSGAGFSGLSDLGSREETIRLHNALLDRGFVSLDSSAELRFTASEISPPGSAVSGNHLNIKLHLQQQGFTTATSQSEQELHLLLEPERIQLKTAHNWRVIPSIAGQCCFARLADYFLTQICGPGHRG